MSFDKIMDWFKAQISLGNILLLVFMTAGFYYTTKHQVESIEESVVRNKINLDEHIEFQFRPFRDDIRSDVQDIDRQLQQMRGNYQSLEKLLREQQGNNNQRFERIEQRLDYIINRIDAQ